MNQIEKIICTALQAHDNQIRNQAEQEIYRLVQINYTHFFSTLAQIIGNETKDVILRTSTASIFKRLISLKDNETFFWDKISIDIKPQIKELLLSTLISQNVALMRGGANAIAQVASIEIPRGEWLDIVDTLAQNTQHSDYNIRRASIITLGFISQELRNMKSNINLASGKQILGSLLLGLSQEGEIVEASLQAIRDSMQFLVPVLENKDYCNKTIEILMPLLINEDLREKVYQIMYEFCKYCYMLAHPYLDLIVQFTTAHMQLRNHDSSRALTLWQVIGSEYLERCNDMNERVNQDKNHQIPNLVQAAQKKILPEVMGLMLIVSKSDEDQAELRENAVNALSVIVECCDRSVVQTITGGVATVAQSSKPGQRQATVLLFSCLCNYPDKADIENRFKNAFVPFYKLMEDIQLIVVRNSLTGFSTLAEYFPEVFMENPEIRQIFMHLLTIAKSQDEVLRNSALVTLCNISEAMEKYPDIPKQPQEEMKELMLMFEKGLASYNQPGSRELNQKILIIMMNIIMNTDNITIVTQLARHLCNLYHNNSNKSGQTDKQLILEEIMSLLHTCLLGLSKSLAPKPQIRDMAFSVVDNHIRAYGAQTETINMISAVSVCFKKEFRDKIDFYWNFILKGLQNYDQKQLFKATLTCIGDLARNHEQHITEKIMEIFDILLRLMRENLDKDVKTEILKGFGDLSLGLKKNTQTFLDPLLEITSSCFDAVYKFSDIQSEKGYAQELKEALIEMYHCVVFAVNSQQQCNQKTASHFPFMCTFIIRSNNLKYKPPIDYLKNCLYLIFDSALFYSTSAHFKPEVTRILNSAEVGDLINNIKKFSGRQEIHELLVFIEEKMRKN